MANEIKQKIVLEGEQQYKNAIKDAQRNLKTLRSELKAETAELGNNATAQQKNETKVKSLKKQIEEQEKIVKANRDALEEVRQKYADNDDAIAKWEQKLNDSRTALANMTNELEKVSSGMSDIETNADMATVATKSVADSLQSLSGIGDTIASGIETVFTTMLDTIRESVAEVWSLISQTAAKANNWTDLGAIFGTTATNIEEMEAAVSAIGGSGKFDSFVTLMNKLSFGGKEDTIQEYLGVNARDYEDNLQYTMDVLTALQKYSNEHHGEATDSLMSNLFGAKKSSDVMWIIRNWSDILEKRGELKETGYLMDEEEVETMNQVQISLNEIDEKWEALKSKFATGFGTVTLDIMTNVNGALDALATYFNAETHEEREKALADLEKNITDAFQRIADAIQAGIEILDKVAENLKESDNPTAKALGTVLSGLVDALKWITEDNMQHVVSALENLAAFWLVGKGASMAAKISSIVADINVIKGYSIASGGANADSGGATWTTGIMSKLSGATAGANAVLASGLGNMVPMIGDWFLNQTNAGRALRDGTDILEGISEDFQEIGDNVSKNADTFEQDWSENVLTQPGKNSILFWDQFWNHDVPDAINQLLNGGYEQGEFYDDTDWEGSAYDVMDAIARRTEEMQGGGNTGNTDGEASSQANAGLMQSAVKGALSGWKVVMDGETVGSIVAPYVNELIAGEINQ